MGPTAVANSSRLRVFFAKTSPFYTETAFSDWVARVWRQLAGNTVGKKKNVGRWETRRRLSLDQVPRKPTDWQLFFLLPGLPLCSRLSCQHLHFSVEPRSPPGPRAGPPLRSSCTPTTAAANALRSSQVAPTSRWHRSSRAQKPPPHCQTSVKPRMWEEESDSGGWTILLEET